MCGAQDGGETVRGVVAKSVDNQGTKTDNDADESKGHSGDVRDQEVTTPVVVDIDHLADCHGSWSRVIRVPGYMCVSLARERRDRSVGDPKANTYQRYEALNRLRVMFCAISSIKTSNVRLPAIDAMDGGTLPPKLKNAHSLRSLLPIKGVCKTLVPCGSALSVPINCRTVRWCERMGE